MLNRFAFLIAFAFLLLAQPRPGALSAQSQPTNTSALTIADIVALAAAHPDLIRAAAQTPDALPANSPARNYTLGFAEMHINTASARSHSGAGCPRQHLRAQ